MPFIDEDQLVNVTVEFRSGTPAMKLPCTQLSLTPDVLTLETEIDGRVQPGIGVRRSSIGRVTVEFDGVDSA
jgi:hypothetical protein